MPLFSEPRGTMFMLIRVIGFGTTWHLWWWCNDVNCFRLVAYAALDLFWGCSFILKFIAFLPSLLIRVIHRTFAISFHVLCGDIILKISIFRDRTPFYLAFLLSCRSQWRWGFAMFNCELLACFSVDLVVDSLVLCFFLVKSSLLREHLPDSNVLSN